MATAATSDEPVDNSTIVISEDLLEVLQLKQFYPQMLGYSAAIKVKIETEDDRQYGLMIIRKLLQMNHEALRVVTTKINNDIRRDLERKSDESKKSKFAVKEQDEVNAKSNRKKLFGLAKKVAAPPHVHPMDLMVTIFNCCDNFLRQMLVEKMFMCRLAVPILLPLIGSVVKTDTQMLLLWGLNAIFLESKGAILKDFSKPLIDIPNPIISFFRVGQLHRSKSKLLNLLLNKTDHHTFYHRDYVNGSAKRRCSNGTIEAAWFISDKKSDFNSEFFTVLNLRGDALNHIKQTRFMCEKSSLVVIMVDSFDSFEKFHKTVISGKFDFTHTRIILVFLSANFHSAAEDDYIENSVFFGQINEVVNGRDWNENEWIDKIQSYIRDFLITTDGSESSLTSIIVNSKFPWDCMKKIYDEAKKRSDEFMAFVKQSQEPFQMSLTSWCPLQGEPWKRLGDLERQKCRRISTKVASREEFNAEIAVEIKKCREEQLENIRQLTAPMRTFCQNVSNLEDITRLFFIKLVKINLDVISREIMPEINKKFKVKMATYRNLPGEKIVALEKELSHVSIGLEHIMREMGQMYEAVKTQSNICKFEGISSQEIYKFPEIVANLLLEGLPLEIMDGDACNVPLTWLKAVFVEIEKQIKKDKKVFVLSIIGIQSTGKSTFLNALFGLQFPVCAGRCTRGIYCHLVPIDTATFLLGYDYILVIDTEGLRAPEYVGESTVRDNELATLAVGLADLTIVNMKGESLSDMQNILQIVVHALIRIRYTKKNLKLMPSCFFVHQNVPAVNAEEKNQIGRMQQLRLLDEMALKAATLESADNVKGFNDIITHDENCHTWYMPDLWNGEPPIATTNIGYSKKVAEVNSAILKMMIEKQLSLKIENFYWRISDLWNALMHDNFVLCFRNTKEILAHRNLDTIITQLFSEMKIQNWHDQKVTRNRITSCDSIERLLKVEDEIRKGQQRNLDESFKIALDKLQEILKDCEYNDLLETSRAQYVQGLTKLADNERNERLNETFRVMEMHKKKLEKCTGVRDLEKTLLQRTKMLLHGNELDDNFETMFDVETSAFKSRYQQSVTDGINLVETEVCKAIYTTLCKSRFVSIEKEQEIGESVKEPFDTDPLRELPKVTEEDIEMEAFNESLMKAVHQKSYITDANNKCREVFHCFELRIGKEKPHTVYCNKIFINGFISDVGNFFGITAVEYDITEELFHQGDNDTVCATSIGYKFKQCYIRKFLIFIGRYVFDRLKCLTQNFIRKTDPYIDILERYKPQLKMIVEDLTTADILANMLLNMAKEAVIKDLGKLIVEKINLSEDKTFKSKRSFLEQILADLAEDGEFSDFVAYLEMPESYFKQKIIMLLQKSSTAFSLFEVKTKALDDILEEIKSCLITAEKKCKCDSKLPFLITFKEILHSKHLFQNIEYGLISDLGIRQLESFTKAVLEKVQILHKGAVTYYRGENEKILNDLQKSEIDPVKELLKKILGCRAKCPFCSAPCLSTTSKHFPADCHRACHYPMGVGGTVKIKRLLGGGKIQVKSVGDKRGSNKLVLETCDTLVDSKKEFRSPDTIKYSGFWHRVLNWTYYPYTKYKKIYPEWDIKLDRTMKTSLYWKWFMVKFQKDLENHYKAEYADIPEDWKCITKEEAVESLEIPI